MNYNIFTRHVLYCLKFYLNIFGFTRTRQTALVNKKRRNPLTGKGFQKVTAYLKYWRKNNLVPKKGVLPWLPSGCLIFHL